MYCVDCGKRFSKEGAIKVKFGARITYACPKCGFLNLLKGEIAPKDTHEKSAKE